ncbi:hypothetical protein [Sphingosinicella terrae]|uniref:hypothetical protein n=1 Tax=Sphingosinicella terrae TaxID=2172047 RepID=UPI000E0D7FFA|nr:hypothetical protein [Sphingosinicella terrae]
MLLTILFAALPAVAAASAPVPEALAGAAAQADKCPDLRPRPVGPADDAQPRRLGDLPPGRLELTVHREVDGCPIPAVLREGIGGAGGRR